MENDCSKDIYCTVEECYYNKDGSKCTASKIEVGSCKDCNASCDTECVTFRPSK